MQIERLAKNPEYARIQFERGGAFFQGWTEGVLPSQDFAPAIAADAVYIYGKRKPLPKSIIKVLEEIEQRAPEADLLPIIFTLGLMVGKGHERWRRTDPQSKRTLKYHRRA